MTVYLADEAIGEVADHGPGYVLGFHFTLYEWPVPLGVFPDCRTAREAVEARHAAVGPEPHPIRKESTVQPQRIGLDPFKAA
jgi:hypothetical protein